MAAEIRAGQLDDPRDELLGILLKSLYPQAVSPTEVLRYLRAPSLVEMTGEYSGFWVDYVPKESPTAQRAKLLDGIAAGFEGYRPFMVGEQARYTRMGHLPVELLKQAVRDRDAEIAPDRLYDWLGVVSDPELGVAEWERSIIGFDHRWNADALKALIPRAVERCLESGEDCAGLVDGRLFGALPFDYAPWCLEMALLGARDERAGSFYVEELFDSVQSGGGRRGLTVAGAREALAGNVGLVKRFEDMARRGGAREPARSEARGRAAGREPGERRAIRVDSSATTRASRPGKRSRRSNG